MQQHSLSFRVLPAMCTGQRDCQALQTRTEASSGTGKGRWLPRTNPDAVVIKVWLEDVNRCFISVPPRWSKLLRALRRILKVLCSFQREAHVGGSSGVEWIVCLVVLALPPASPPLIHARPFSHSVLCCFECFGSHAHCSLSSFLQFLSVRMCPYIIVHFGGQILIPFQQSQH